LKRRSQPSAEAAQAETVVFEGAGAEERFEARASDILCLRANDNYVTAYAMSGQGEVESALLRMTLKYAESRLREYAFVARCHKSYIVNLQCVEDVAGNAQGYKLSVPPLDFTVPVSRSYHSEVLRQLRGYRDDEETGKN
jgi:DNA-binding LytR/AlgR family response regulator